MKERRFIKCRGLAHTSAEKKTGGKVEAKGELQGQAHERASPRKNPKEKRKRGDQREFKGLTSRDGNRGVSTLKGTSKKKKKTHSGLHTEMPDVIEGGPKSDEEGDWGDQCKVRGIRGRTSNCRGSQLDHRRQLT